MVPELRDSEDVRRFTRRVTFHERPSIVAGLQKLAEARGHSLASEIRNALRYWIQVNGDDEG
jgi:hypothetical protein